MSGYDKPADVMRPNPTDPGMPPLVDLHLSHEAGYGVGYPVDSWLRVDATVDQRAPSRVSTYSPRSNLTTGYNIEAGDVSALTGLFSISADLGT